MQISNKYNSSAKPPLALLGRSNQSRDSTLDFFNNMEQPTQPKAANYAQQLDNSFDFPNLNLPPY